MARVLGPTRRFADSLYLGPIPTDPPRAPGYADRPDSRERADLHNFLRYPGLS